MIKMHCDKCGEEIKDKYYTINIYGHDTNPKYNYATSVDSASACSNSREDMLRILNSTKMYCKDCKDKVEAYLWSNTGHPLT